MADKNSNNRKLLQMLDNLDSVMDNIYASTYHSNKDNDIAFDRVSSDLNDAIKQAIEGDQTYQDIANTTKLYQKVLKQNGGSISPLLGSDSSGNPTSGNIMEMFADGALLANLMETYADTKWIEQLDEDIDLCIKYMPKLKIALNIKKDNVLCADSFQKSFINVKRTDTVGDELEAKFSANIKQMIKTYHLNELAEEWYDHASTYGETFVWVVPYNRALSELLSRKANTQGGIGIMKESTLDIHKSGIKNSDNKISVTGSVNESDSSLGTINLKLDNSSVISDVIEKIHEVATRINKEPIFRSVYESFLEEVVTESNHNFETHLKKDKNNVEIKLDKTIDDVLEYEEDNTSNDGLVSSKKQSNNPEKLKVPGAVVRELERSKVIPLYIEDICLGYYYIRINPSNLVDVNMNATTNGYNSITSMFNTNTATDKEINGDILLKQLAGEISRSIDSNFINNNTDLKKEIYMMLKYNDTFNRVVNAVDMNVTFIPAEDIIHYHFNFDRKTHRGRSDLWNSLIPAKMWIMINTTTTIGQTTRAQDRRVYYVKNVVDTNVSKTLINVVNQIKKGNFGLRQIESINNILGIVGKFNDFVIPVGPSGDSPITFDIMQGQQFDLPTDLMQNLEENAVSQIVPLEIVNSSNQMDFAIRYTMTNAMLLRDVLKRQVTVEDYMTRILNKIYVCEFEDNASFEVVLPPPAFLTLTQGTQLIQNAVQYAEQITEIEMADKSDKERNLFKKKLVHKYLTNYIDIDMINRIKEEIKIELSIDKHEKKDEEM